MHRFRHHRYSAFAVVVASAFLSAQGFGQSVVIGSGVQSWVDAARTGRADMFAVGDSIVWYFGNGWDAGLANGFAEHTGLAGTGLIPDNSFTREGEGYSAWGSWYSGITDDPNAVPAPERDFAWRTPITVGSTPSYGFGFGVEGNDKTLDSTAAFDWHLWTASPAGGGTLGAYRRADFGGGYPTTQTIAPTALPDFNGQLTKTVIHFNATDPIYGGSLHEMLIQNTANTSIMYSRLLQPGAKGATVSSWGYGGHDTLQFLQDIYFGGTLDALGRRALLTNMVDSSPSGKLNILIGEGLNDRNDPQPSYHGVANSNTPAGFKDNILSLMSAIRTDWSGGGHNLADLSFTLLSQYDIDGGTGNDQVRAELRDFAAQLRQIALSDPQVAFIDVYDLAPRYDQSLANHYIVDGIHPSYDGSLAFGETVVSALLSVPTSNWNAAGGSANWSNSGNWSGAAGMPNASDVAVNFTKLTLGAGTPTVTVDVPRTVGRINFNSSDSYTITGPGTITLDVVAGRPAINVTSGTHTISAPIVLNKDTTITTAYGTGVVLSGNLTATGKVIAKAGSGSVQFENVCAAALHVNGGTATIRPKPTPNASAGTSVVQLLTIEPGAVLDLTNNAMVIDYGSSVGATVVNLRTQLQSGLLVTSGFGPAHQLGYADNALLHKTSFAGQAVDLSSVLIAFTYGGDANLDGKVDVTDLGALATNWQTYSTWTAGDFNYDRLIDVTDLGILATNWQQDVSGGASPASSFDQALAAVGLGGASVPEPATLTMVALAGLGVSRCRRRS